MFGDGMQKNELPLIIVCDDKDMVYANYLIQCIESSPAAAGALSQRPLGLIKTATSVHASGHPAKQVRSRRAEPVQR